MGLCGSSLTDEQRLAIERSREIDRVNAQQAMVTENKVKLLLLGTGDSGKSTIFKQMKILYGVGFSHDELVMYTPLVHYNCVEGMKALVEAAQELDLPLRDKALAESFLEVDDRALVDERVGSMLKALWVEEGIRAAYERRSEFQFADSAAIFLEDIDRVKRPGFVATVNDVLLCRKQTTGIIKERYVLDDDLVLEMYDVGGQRNERKKWIHHFDDVNAVIFVAAISEYDQCCFEDHTQNRLMEALHVFDEICNSTWFEHKSVILFLNKVDLFEQKVRVKDVRQEDRALFLDYTAGTCQCKPDIECECGVQQAAKDFIMQLFFARNRVRMEKQLYCHTTCATDTSNIKHVFHAVKETILWEKIEGSTYMYVDRAETMTLAKPQIFAEDMTNERMERCLAIAQEAFNMPTHKGSTHSCIAEHIRGSADKEFGRSWNCIVGRDFGAYVTHVTKTFIYFSVARGVCVLLWKC